MGHGNIDAEEYEKLERPRKRWINEMEKSWTKSEG